MPLPAAHPSRKSAEPTTDCCRPPTAREYDINGSIIKLETGSEISYYKKEKGQLRLLDYEKKEITGALADNYILKKIKDCAGKAENGK